MVEHTRPIMSSTTYDGIRQTNAFYHSVIEDVTRNLQSVFIEEKEEEKKRLKKTLEEKRQTLKTQIEKQSKKGGGRKKGGKGGEGTGGGGKGVDATDGAEVQLRKELASVEARLKKPNQLFDPEELIAGEFPFFSEWVAQV